MEICVYCGRHEGTTRDHVPPRCFFPTPMPNINRITVPCCDGCRISGGKNEALVRNIFISTIEAEPHAVVQSQLASKRTRSWEIDRTQFEAMLNAMVDVHLWSAAGRHLDWRPAFNLDRPVINDFFDRILRALVHEEREAGYVPSVTKWRLIRNPRICADFPANAKARFVGDTFSYHVAFVIGSLGSMWLITFYERLHVMAHFQPIAA